MSSANHRRPKKHPPAILAELPPVPIPPPVPSLELEAFELKRAVSGLLLEIALSLGVPVTDLCQELPTQADPIPVSWYVHGLHARYREGDRTRWRAAAVYLQRVQLVAWSDPPELVAWAQVAWAGVAAGQLIPRLLEVAQAAGAPRGFEAWRICRAVAERVILEHSTVIHLPTN